ncbi:hypothetical protein Cgig2_002204 [Carnegiea gigantea]|uniref:Uncharacterized protein n=1 Tax=Carnegiea gigantea TaxID=171969 RepID=A0A9Q1K1D9_9CARY|nr:hypothetical protein Cgig2_002204 [Carnegiea gigantea]
MQKENHQKEINQRKRNVQNKAAFAVTLGRATSGSQCPTCKHYGKMSHEEQQCYEIIGYPAGWVHGEADVAMTGDKEHETVVGVLVEDADKQGPTQSILQRSPDVAWLKSRLHRDREGLSDYEPLLLSFLNCPRVLSVFGYCDMWSSDMMFTTVVIYAILEVLKNLQRSLKQLTKGKRVDIH